MADAITATVGAVAGIGSSVIGARSADKAADASADASKASIKAQVDMFNRVDATLKPFREGGQKAFLAYLGETGVKGFEKYKTGDMPQIMERDQFENTEEYQFGLEQGMDALEGTAAARGGLLSGKAVQEAQQFGQEYGLSKYEDYRSRMIAEQQRHLQNLFGAAQVGQASAARTGSIGAQTGAGIAQSHLQAGAAKAEAAIAKGQAISGGFGDLATGVAGMSGAGMFGG